MTEVQEQATLFKWTLSVRQQYPELKLLHHIKNETTGGARQVAVDKSQGVKPGVPDLCLPVARRGYHGLYIEMKTENGRTSDAQDWWIEQLNAQGYFAEVCHGWQSAVKVIEWYLTKEGGNDNG